MEDKYEELGQCIDSLNNYIHAIKIPMPAEFHIDVLKDVLPELHERFKKAFIELTRENPW